MLKIDARIFKIDARIFDIDARIFKIDARIRNRVWRLVHLAAELRTPRSTPSYWNRKQTNEWKMALTFKQIQMNLPYPWSRPITSICMGESLKELVSTPLDGDGERDSVSESE